MLTKMILLGCLFGLAVLSITTTKAQDDSFQFKIPKITRDIRYNEQTSEHVAQSVTNFAHNLAVAIDTNEFPNTQIFSPLSIMSVLSLLQMGAYGNSYTQLNQLFDLLNGQNGDNSSKIHEEFGWLLEDVVSKMENPKRPHTSPKWRLQPFDSNAVGASQPNKLDNHTIRVSSAIFVQNDFSLRPDYAYAAQSVYKSEVTPLDFRHKKEEAKDYINSWVNQNTLGKIPAIIDDELESDTNMILASTLYFKGFWQRVFFQAEINGAFYPDGPESYPVDVNYMGTGGSFPFYHSHEYNCRIIGLPYNGNQTTMYVIQPIDSTRLKLQQLKKDLTGERLNELISKMQYETTVLVFPKFHVETKMQLKTPLQSMGIEDIFINGRADLSLIADPEENSAKAIPSSSSSSAASNFGAIPAPVPVRQHIEEMLQDSPATLSFASQRSPYSGPLDRYDEAPLIFSRFGEDSVNKTMETPEGDDPMVETSTDPSEEMSASVVKGEDAKIETMPANTPSETSTESNPNMKMSRKRRQAIPDSAISLEKLDQLRSTPGLKKPKLYVDEILHKVDFNVNEQGTEAAAATLSSLRRSGTTVSMRCDAPFLILVRHDPTKLPLFYGIINIPA